MATLAELTSAFEGIASMRISLIRDNVLQSTKFFKMPNKDIDINVLPIIKEVLQYSTTKLFYQEYVSLMVQDVKRIELSLVVREKGSASDEAEEIISEDNYIFEPSTYSVAAHL